VIACENTKTNPADCLTKIQLGVEGLRIIGGFMKQCRASMPAKPTSKKFCPMQLQMHHLPWPSQEHQVDSLAKPATHPEATAPHLFNALPAEVGVPLFALC